MKQVHSFRIDLAKTDRKGAFSCPSCGITISPSDNSERTYSILETRMNYEELEEVLICCKNCGSQICLTGFPKYSEPYAIRDVAYISHI